MDKTHAIFISYTTREDEVRQVTPLVQAVVAELRQHGYGTIIDPLVWWDKDRIGDFAGGEDALKRILEEAIAQSWKMLAFVSPLYWKSKWCRFEWELAEAHWARSPSVQPGPIVWKRDGDIREFFPPADRHHCIRAYEPDGWWETPPYRPADMPRILNDVIRFVKYGGPG